jgi:glycosyl hydrolase family 71
MGWNENTTAEALPNVFKAANSLGNTFKLFFSLDYAGNGAWPQDEVIALVNAYRNNDAYFKHNGQPLVSTFEGPANASDWNTIKPATNAFFISSYSSLGAKDAMKTGVVDGLFSWGAWQEGPHDNHNTVDESYRQFLDGKPYMMPVSPWFYTNMPGFRKNWLWRGDDLWYDR